MSRKPIHLAAHFPGVNNTTVWTDPSAGSQIEFDSFVHLARTAERGLFDFFFLAEGLRLREHRGRIHDLDVVGRPDTFTVLAALAGVTDRIGLTGTINTTFNEPFEVARQFATLDHLSGGRAGWNIVTSSDAFTGANFRRGGFLKQADRYRRAEEFVTVARQFWDSWSPDAVVSDVAAEVYVDPDAIRSVEYSGSQFDVRGFATLPAGPQGHPVLLQAGDSDEGRGFGARYADALFTLHGSIEDGQR
jgi:FMN-dependent oxidoreductase (nitrilotriacetate monooxygenase family)